MYDIMYFLPQFLTEIVEFVSDVWLVSVRISAMLYISNSKVEQ